MFNWEKIKNILLILVDSITATMSIILLIKSEKIYKRIFAIVILLGIVTSLILSFLFVQADNIFSADLCLSIYRPLVINQDSTYNDEYLIDANYRVLCAVPYPKGTKFKLEIKNLLSWETRKYDITDVKSERNIGKYLQGKYMIKIYKDGELIQEDIIDLSYSNTKNDGKWHCNIFTIKGFYDEAISKKIIIGADNRKRLHYFTFTIRSENNCICPEFATNVVNYYGQFEGDFYFIPGKYYLNNVAEPDKMKKIEILVK